MPEFPDHARKMLEELRREALAHIGQVQEAVAMMNMIEGKYAAPRTDLLELLGGLDAATLGQLTDGTPAEGLGSSRPTTRPASTSLRAVPIRPDQFLGKPPLEAAKMYLAQRGHAASIDEIADAISKGGAAIKGSGWRDVLERSLIRSVADVVKVQEGVFGLTRFYTDEQIKALRATRRQASPKSGAGGHKGRRPKVKLARRRTTTGRSTDEPPRSAAANGASPARVMEDET